MAVYLPPLAAVLKLVNPTLTQWALILVTSLVPLGLGQVAKALRWV
jgi:hypothetical protein